MAALAALGAAAAAPICAQTFTEDISVVEVEVPVQVLVGGRSVRGLARENFELRVDGRPQPLSYFRAIEIDERLGLEAPAAAADSQTAAPPAAWSRHYLTLFDLAFSSRYRVLHAVDALRRMVAEQSQASDRLAIAIFSPVIGARVLVPFTTDRQAFDLGLDLVTALADAKPKRSVEALETLDAWWSDAYDPTALPEPLLADMGRGASTLIQPLENPPALAGVGMPIALDGAAPSAADARRYRTARLNTLFKGGGDSLSAVRALGRSMASLVTLLRDIPDPKHVIFLSQGLGGMLDGAETRTPTLHRLKPMVDALADTGWTLQAIDIGGIRPPGGASVLTGPGEAYPAVEVGLGAVTTAGSNNSSLFYLANESGGELFENYNRIDGATAKILDRTKAIYLLGFQPAGLAADGERYDIQVRLTPEIPKARILHRPNFRAPRPPTARLLSERRMDAAELALSGRRIDELQARVLATVLPRAGGGRVPVFVEVDAASLDAGKKGRKRVRLDVHGYALDADGVVRAGFARELRFRRRGERLVGVMDEISLPAGGHELRVLVWDLRGRRRHLSSTSLAVPAGPATPTTPLGPFFVASRESRRQFTPSEIEPPAALTLFMLGDETAAVDVAPAILRGRGRRFLLFAPPATESGELELRLLDADGASIPHQIDLEPLADGADGTARFAGVFEGRALAPGRYQLEAALEDGSVSMTGFELVE